MCQFKPKEALEPPHQLPPAAPESGAEPATLGENSHAELVYLIIQVGATLAGQLTAAVEASAVPPPGPGPAIVGVHTHLELIDLMGEVEEIIIDASRYGRSLDDPEQILEVKAPLRLYHSMFRRCADILTPLTGYEYLVDPWALEED